jgi:hypothetical protein
MRKFFFLTFLVTIGVAVQAQSRFGIFAGPQASSARYSIDGEKQSTSYKYGFQLGAGWKIPFDNQLYFAPAAFYSMKGYKVELDRPSYPPDPYATNNDTRLHTFELAFLLQYDLGKKPSHFFLKAGPSLDFQLKGTEKFERSNGSPVDRSMIFSFGDYGRYAASFLFQFGYEAPSGWFGFAQYNHGVGSFNNADHGPKILHRVWGLSVGHYFGKKKK